VNQETVLQALRPVLEPAFGKSLVDLGWIQGIEVADRTVRMTVSLSAPSEAARAQVHADVHAALQTLGDYTPLITWDLQVPMRETMGEDPIPEVRNVILVMSGKGGVGKSTNAVNLALALARGGARVGLLDADIYGPSIPTMMGISEPPTSKDGTRIEPLEQHGLKLMSIGFMLESPTQAVIWRGPMLHGALQQFLKDVNWGALDYLVFDLPPGTGDVALTVAQRMRVTGAVIVTTPQEVALQDVYKSVSLCQKLNIPILGVIENMSYFVDSAGVRHELFGSGGGKLVAEFAKAPLLGQIPIDPTVRQWGDQGTPVVKAAPESEVAKSFVRLAHELSMLVAKKRFQETGGEKAPSASGPTRLRILR
jgi:ATP-binding protein involved in chromosome partitioning